MTFKTSSGIYQLRRRWWRGWVIEKWDRMGEQIVSKGWWPLSDDEALELVASLREKTPEVKP